jgi:hydroperoxide dehydratase
VLWETSLAKGEKASVSDEVKQFAFNFLMRAVCHHDPAAPGEYSLGRNGGPFATAWANPQLAPIAGQTGLPHVVEELVLHTVPLPSALVKKNYDALYNFIKNYATEALDRAEAMGIERNDATANLLFFLCFNAYGGFNIFFPLITILISSCGPELMHDLHDEVTKAVAATDGKVTLQSIENMPLVKSVVYEAFRFKPPVPYQYGKAKFDFTIENHENSFEVKKGEMLYGYQPIVTHDPKVFKDPDQFLPRRFMGPDGEKLIKYVFWSNGYETDKPTTANKQCAGKDLVVTMARAFVAEMFLRYKEYTLSMEGAGNATKIFFSDLKK